MKLSRLTAFTLGVIVTAVSVSAVSYVNALNDKPITACADRKTGVMRYIDKGRCKRTERALTWNQVGPQGLQGIQGTKGDMGAVGTPGANTRLAITELSICGENGATLCTIGSRGPGGGLIFYVDYNDQYPGFNYLEAAPTEPMFIDGPDDGTEPDFRGPWATALPVVCRPNVEGPCATESLFPLLTRDEEEVQSRNLANGVAMTQLVVSLHPGAAKNSYAAGIAEDYVSPTFRGSVKTDWYLPSTGAMEKIQANLIESGLGGFTITSDGYWTSSPIGDYPLEAYAWDTYQGDRHSVPLSHGGLVRPIRAF
jgi:hypothetical protein